MLRILQNGLYGMIGATMLSSVVLSQTIPADANNDVVALPNYQLIATFNALTDLAGKHDQVVVEGGTKKNITVPYQFSEGMNRTLVHDLLVFKTAVQEAQEANQRIRDQVISDPKFSDKDMQGLELTKRLTEWAKLPVEVHVVKFATSDLNQGRYEDGKNPISLDDVLQLQLLLTDPDGNSNIPLAASGKK